jgi:hypothetical protein
MEYAASPRRASPQFAQAFLDDRDAEEPALEVSKR